jgi:hypothetical protein
VDVGIVDVVCIIVGVVVEPLEFGISTHDDFVAA